MALLYNFLHIITCPSEGPVRPAYLLFLALSWVWLILSGPKSSPAIVMQGSVLHMQRAKCHHTGRCFYTQCGDNHFVPFSPPPPNRYNPTINRVQSLKWRSLTFFGWTALWPREASWALGPPRKKLLLCWEKRACSQMPTTPGRGSIQESSFRQCIPDTAATRVPPARYLGLGPCRTACRCSQTGLTRPWPKHPPGLAQLWTLGEEM